VKSVLAAVLWLLICVMGVMVVEGHDRQRLEQAAGSSLQERVATRGVALQQALDDIAAQSRVLVQALSAQPDMPSDALHRLAARAVEQQPLIASVMLTRKLKAIFVHPIRGNEAIAGLDYDLRPEFLAAIQRADTTRKTVFDAPVRMLQTGKPGVIARTAVYVDVPEADSEELWGEVSIGVDLQALLASAGLRDRHYAIRSHTPGELERAVVGDQGLFLSQQPGGSYRIRLPDGFWEMTARVPQAYPPGRAWAIRVAGLLAAVVPMVLLPALARRRYGDGNSIPFAVTLQGSGHRRRYPLRTLLLLAIVVPVPLLAALAGWLSYQSAMRTAEELEQRQAGEVAARIRDKAQAFFDVPRQMVVYNAEQFRAGLLQPQQAQAMVLDFLLQLRRQPMLTFLSISTQEGGYYAASRPPLGADRSLRMLSATPADGGVMRITRVGLDYRPNGDEVTGNSHYDPRERPWYQTTLAARGVRWYPTYRYAIDDPEGLYDGLGMGMAVALRDAQQQLIGVLAADVSLSQLSEFLHEQLTPLGGYAYVTEGSGLLLASSGSEPVYRLRDGRTERIHVDASDSVMIRATHALTARRADSQGRARVGIGDERFLVNWQTMQLPEGPTLQITIGLPQKRFSGEAQETLRAMGFVTLTFLALGMVLAVWCAHRLSWPLLSIHRWARQLADGQWQARAPIPSAVREMDDLSVALGDMAQRLRLHTQELEQRVAERTVALEAANRQLEALASTDGLTGVANRRHFDNVAAAEWARAQRSRQPLALILLDVDHFKRYNDCHGHQAGDDVLRAVALVLDAAARRAGDLAARYGGEEFVVVAPNTDTAAAANLAEGLRSGVQRLALAHGAAPAGVVTISVGVAVFMPGSADSLQQLLAQADQALYRAKQLGRNRVEVAGGS